MKRMTFKRIIGMAMFIAIMLGIMQVPAQAYDTARLPATDYSLCTTAAIDENNNLWVWGSNPGDGTELATTPVKVLENVISYSRGRQGTSAAIKSDSSLWMWGNNSFGQLGDGTKTDSLVPIKVMDDVISVSCSLGTFDWDRGFTAAIKKDGSLWTWGCAYSGLLGNGKRGYDVDSLPPQKIMTDVCAVSCGYNHAAAIKKDGSLWTWGRNHYVQLGYIGPNSGDSTEDSTEPIYIQWDPYEATPAKVMDDVTCVSCGNYFTAVVKKDGSLWTFGNNSYGKLGIGVGGSSESGWSEERNAPRKIMDDVRTVSCGDSHMAILKNDGSLWTCGDCDYGALGNGKWALKGMGGEIVGGQGVDINTPIKIMDDVVDVSCEYHATIALKKDGSYWTWGVNYSGELGYPDGEIRWGMNGTLDSYIQSSPRQPEYPFTPKMPRKRINVANFNDVFVEDYYADAVKWAVENNITSGVGSSRFDPTGTCTRGQIVTFLWRAMGSPTVDTDVSFSDVVPGAYYEDAVKWAVANNVTSGTGDGSTFSPDVPCDRAQAVTFMWRANGEPAASGSSFGDVQSGSYYEDAVKWAVANNITSGTSSTTFSPNQSCARGQIVTFLYRNR